MEAVRSSVASQYTLATAAVNCFAAGKAVALVVVDNPAGVVLEVAVLMQS